MATLIGEKGELMINMETGERFFRDLSKEERCARVILNEDLTDQEKLEQCEALGISLVDLLMLAIEIGRKQDSEK